MQETEEEKSNKYMSGIEQEKQSNNIISIPIEWHISDEIKSRYASNALVQHGEYEFIISFIETQPPFLGGTPEENKAKLEQLKAVRAECVARIIVKPELVPKIINALQTELDQYLAAKKEE